MAIRIRWIVVLLVTLAINRCASQNNARNLKYSTVFWNSGAHAFEYTYKKDPYHNIDIWRYGRGELTNMGANQSFYLGRFLREKYNNFLDPVVVKDVVVVKSIDDDKSVGSALAVLAGLYPVTYQGNSWSSSLTTWRPISIRTSSPNDNDYLSLPVTDNADYSILKDEIFSSDWMRDYEAQNIDFFRNAERVTGEIWNMTNISMLADNILSLDTHDRPLLRFWHLPGSIQKLNEMYAIHMGSLFTDKNREYAIAVSQLQGGVLLNQIVESMKNKTQNIGNMQLMSAFSVPTTTLVGLLVTLGNYDWIAPDFASSLMFDLYGYNNGTYEVEVSYRNGERPVTRLGVRGCRGPCQFQQFQKIASNFFLNDSTGGAVDSRRDSQDMEEQTGFSSCDSLLLGFIATLFIMSFIAIGIVLYLLGRPVANNPNPIEFERIE